MAHVVHVEFQWDSTKNQENIKKHRISFEEASKLFELQDNLILELYDFEHSIDEDRIISIGPINRGVVVVVSVERGEVNILRLISARFASNAERRRYERAIAGIKYD